MTHSFSEPPIHPPNVQMKNASTQEDGETWLTMLVEDPDLHAPDATKLDLSSIIEKQITTNAQNQPNNETEYAISTHLHSSHHISIHSSPLSNSFRGQETQSVIPVFKNQDNAFYYPSLNKCCQTEPSFKSPPTVSMNMIHANQSPPNLDHQYLNPQADNPNHFENARLKFTSSSQVFKKSYGKFVNALDIVASNSLARMHRFSRENSSMSTLAISEYTGTIE